MWSSSVFLAVIEVLEAGIQLRWSCRLQRYGFEAR